MQVKIIKIFIILLFSPVLSSEVNLTYDKQEYMQALMTIASGNEQQLEEFIKSSADINKKYGPNEESLLHMAITGCNLKAAQLLISHHIIPDQQDKRGWTPLTNVVAGAPSHDKTDYAALTELLFEQGKVTLDKKTMAFLSECKNQGVVAVIERFEKESREKT